MKAIVTGMIATYPVGGVVWDYGQYALGLERLGFEVYYLEDTGSQTYDPRHGLYGDDCAYGVAFLADALTALSPGLGRRWHFRNGDGATYGISPSELAHVVATADLFLNVSGGTLLRDEYMACPHKVLIDSDPGWNHFHNYPRWDAAPNWQGTHGYRAHDHFFTYAERIGREGCVLPDMGLLWHPTRPPVVLDCWKPEPPGEIWTTVMTWKNFNQTIVHDGVTYGTKEIEFEKVETAPMLTSARLEMAMGGAPAPYDRWREIGWSIVSSEERSVDAEIYRSYIERSRGEFSVAKNVYVATRSGWFSCRSVCYLAAGRPVVIQDTGFSEVIPTGDGLLAFSNLEEAIAGLDAVERNYAHHQAAARHVAEEHFGSERVLRHLLDCIGVN
jgi:hypothetical protein